MPGNCVQITTIIGSFLLIMPNGLAWYWGNVSVYALSYIVYSQESPSSVQAPWIISIFLISWITSMLSCNLIARLLMRRVLILLSILTSDLAIFMSYFAIQHSMALLTVTCSVFNGLATGFLYGNAIYLVIQCAGKRVGILSSVLQAGFPTGAIIITQLVTWYCNPYNKIPDLKLGSTVYFTQKDVLDKIPSIFLVMGSFYLASHIAAFIFLQFNPEMKCGACSKNVETETLLMTENCQDKKLDKSLSNGLNSTTAKDHTPKEVLKCTAFYFLWLSLFMNDFPFTMLTNYYKLFGQIWIHDDIFLTNVGTAMLFSSFFIRLAWGYGVDRLGVKFSFLCLFGSLAILSAWYYFTAIVSRWLYFIATLAYGGICSSIFGCYMAATAVLFGKTHVSTHFGMLMTASMVFNSIAPVVFQNILIRFGWFSMFAISSVLNIVNLTLYLIFIDK